MTNRRIAAVALILALGACTEKLTSPVGCPDACPGGQQPVLDLVIPADGGRDSSFAGYCARGQGISLLVADGGVDTPYRAFVRFNRRADSVTISGTNRKPYTIDSIAIAFSVIGRDTLVPGLRFRVHRVPVAFDTLTTFAEVDAQLVTATLVDSIAAHDDSLHQRLRLMVRGEKLATMAIPAADTGVIALGLALSAASPTGARLGNIAAGGDGPSITTYVSAVDADSTVKRELLTGPVRTVTVAQNTPALDGNLLTVGGAPSARSLIRFTIPPVIRDSATVLRATLELVPNGPIPGLANDGPFVVVRGVRADLGAKSPAGQTGFACQDLPVDRGVSPRLAIGGTEPVPVEVVDVVRTWQGPDGAPPTLFMRLSPEAGSFTRAEFHSSRSAGTRPQLRITYTRSFPFENP